jgi:hypothetical protein
MPFVFQAMQFGHCASPVLQPCATVPGCACLPMQREGYTRTVSSAIIGSSGSGKTTAISQGLAATANAAQGLPDRPVEKQTDLDCFQGLPGGYDVHR